jgi:hypothetical protein
MNPVPLPISALDVTAVHPSLSDDEADALAAWYNRRNIETVADVDALPLEEREALLDEYLLLVAGSTDPRRAILKALASEEPDGDALDDPKVAETFPRARAAVRRVFESVELRAAGLLAVAIAQRRAREAA